MAVNVARFGCIMIKEWMPWFLYFGTMEYDLYTKRKVVPVVGIFKT